MPLGNSFERQDGEIVDTIYVCSECEAEHHYEEDAMDCCTYSCEQCGEIYDYPGEAEECCNYRCDYCGVHYDDPDTAYDCCFEERAANEQEEFQQRGEYPPAIEDVDVDHVIYIPEIENRPLRICSVEQELSRGGAAVARLLHNIGISQYDSILNYSYDGSPGQAIVKHDGSLSRGGGEVVYSRFNLGDIRSSQSASKALACMQALEQEGIVEALTDAGTHIHMSAMDLNRRPFGPAQMAACYEIFSFGEDVIFRMAAAGTPGHRGQSYTQRMPKFNQEDKAGITPSKIAKQSQRERYFSLNFQRLLNAVRQCRCGACIVGDWDGCDCDVLQTGTIEWRVFNATTDPEILHAWLLLAHGVTAASFTHQIGTLDPHEYNGTSPELHPWIFGWLLWNCPYEDSERQILFNTARRSPGLNLPWDNIDQFHDGWGELEVPELPAPAVAVDDSLDSFDEPEPDGAFAGCDCVTCTEARRIQAEEATTVPESQWTAAQGGEIRFDDRVIQVSDINWSQVAQDLQAFTPPTVEVPEFLDNTNDATNPDVPF